ncbi:hypothetical protein AMTRI_Chr06g170120 [Amborella trichopoda]
MDTQPSHSIPRTEKKNKNYYWNAHQDDYFIDLMVNEVSRGRKTGGVFHKDAWNAMTKAMKAKYGEDFDKDRLRNRLKTIKGQYSNVKQLLQQSGFWWNEETKMVTGDEAVWDDFIQEHAWAAKYRKTAVRKYGDMAICFGDPVVDGSFSQTGHDAPLKENTPLGDATPNDLTGGMSPADFGSPIFDLVEKVSQASSSGGNARASSTACKKRRRSSSLVVPRMIQAGLTQQFWQASALHQCMLGRRHRLCIDTSWEECYQYVDKFKGVSCCPFCTPQESEASENFKKNMEQHQSVISITDRHRPIKGNVLDASQYEFMTGRGDVKASEHTSLASTGVNLTGLGPA